MEVVLRKYYWVVTLFVVALCAYFAANTVSQWLRGMIPVPRRRVSVGQRLSAPPLAKKTRAVIYQRNIFCSTCEAVELAPPVESGASSESAVASNEPVRSDAKIQLISTLVSDDPAWSFAAVRDQEENETHMVRVDSELPGGGKVLVVEELKLIIQRNGRKEYIDFGAKAVAKKPAAPAPKARPRPARKDPFIDSVASGIKSVGPNKWEIKRSALNKVLGNTTQLARMARIVPSVKGGKPNGFKLYAIRPGSLYTLIGLQNGDTIHAINGHAMTTPDKALEVYTNVRHASHLTISFSRGGKTKTHDYTIR